MGGTWSSVIFSYLFQVAEEQREQSVAAQVAWRSRVAGDSSRFSLLEAALEAENRQLKRSLADREAFRRPFGFDFSG